MMLLFKDLYFGTTILYYLHGIGYDLCKVVERKDLVKIPTLGKIFVIDLIPIPSHK